MSDHYSIKEIKYFHPSGEMLPNGSHYQRGGFLNECRKNINCFRAKSLCGEPHGLAECRGGVIVFSAKVAELSTNQLVNEIKQFFESKKKRFNKSKIHHDTIMNLNNGYTRNNDEYNGAYSLGCFFIGKYVGDNGDVFNDTSICLKMNGLSRKSMLKLAETIVDGFQTSILVKGLTDGKIYLVGPNESYHTCGANVL